jgi:hypothetical protein
VVWGDKFPINGMLPGRLVFAAGHTVDKFYVNEIATV